MPKKSTWARWGEKPISVKCEKIAFESEGAMLRGRIYQREALDTASPLVVMAHGLSRAIAMTLNKRGVYSWQR